MKTISGFGRSLVLTVSAVALSGLTIVLAAIPLEALRGQVGRWVYWFTGLGISVGLFGLGQASVGITFALMVVLMGVFAESERLGISLIWSGLLTIFATLGFSAIAVGVWVKSAGVNLLEIVKNQVNVAATRLMEVNPEIEVDIASMTYQVPSGIIILMILSLAVALIWSPRLADWMREEKPESESESEVTQRDLGQFTLPHFFAWVGLFSIAGSFIEFGYESLKLVSLNILNIIVLLYFFQGLSIVGSFFKAYKVSRFWQILWYFMLVVQLFPLVSLIGFTEIWFEYRKKIRNRIQSRDGKIV